ncbi:MAG: hypothetical protein QME62_06105 [Armatimonadota bacterium]|nr:hypothetical protein [Armatimonadota bacterium]
MVRLTRIVAILPIIAISLTLALLILGCSQQKSQETAQQNIGAAQAKEQSKEPAKATSAKQKVKSKATSPTQPKQAKAETNAKQKPQAKLQEKQGTQSKPTASEKTQPKPAKPSQEPAPKPAPGAIYIDSEDPKFVEGPRPELPTDGSPVVITYRIPRMFSLNFKGRETSEGNQGISFLTMTISGEAGSDAEIHLVVRDRSKPIEPIFRITAKTAQKGQIWRKSITGMEIETKLLDYATDSGLSITGPALVAIKVQIKATLKP